jgi:hypothetical protein
VKRKFLLIFGVIATALVTVLATSGIAKANTLYFWGNICHSSQCINNTGGFLGGGNVLQFWNYGSEPNNDWKVWYEGTVQCGVSTFPFETGNGALLTVCNQFYKGDPVLKIAFAPNQVGKGVCIDSSEFTSTQNDALAVIEKCLPVPTKQRQQWFIWNPNQYLVSVDATALSFSYQQNHTLWLGGCSSNITDGQDVCITYDHRLQFDFVNVP